MKRPIMKYKRIEAAMRSWDSLFTEAAQFATELGKERVVSVSHSSDGGTGVIVVWYWGEPGEGGALSPATSGGEVSET